MDYVKTIVDNGFEAKILSCSGVYDTIITVKYGTSPKENGWIYLKDDKIVLMHIKDTEFSDINSFIQKLKELKK